MWERHVPHTHQSNQQRIQDRAVRAAYDLLVERALDGGYTANAGGGKAPNVTFRRGRFYPFSFIPNRTHLTFYVRVPMLRRLPALANTVEVEFEDVRPNKLGERKIYVRNQQEALKIAERLFPLGASQA